jgi:hypothetical protein
VILRAAPSGGFFYRTDAILKFAFGSKALKPKTRSWLPAFGGMTSERSTIPTHPPLEGEG